jgi:hypothetical protein
MKDKIVFNPFTGNFDFVGKGLSKSDIIKSILVESNQSIPLPVAAILFDEDSILYNDDDEEL